MTSFALFVVSLSLFSPAMAADTLSVATPDPMLEAWRWRTFDRASGLAGPLRNITEDRDGNIWFATDDGAQRYDGLHWTTFTTEDGLASNQVYTIIQALDGAMWFGTRAGISRLQGTTWTSYTTADGLPSDKTAWRGLLQARDGTIWAGFGTPGDSSQTVAGISRFDGRSWSAVELPGDAPPPSVQDIHQSRDGSIWFTTFGQGLLRFDGAQWTRYTAEKELAGNDLLGILESRDGSLWFACYSAKAICRYDGRQWRSYTARDGLDANLQPISLWETRDGAIWVGGIGSAICRYKSPVPAPKEANEPDSRRALWKVYTRDDLPQMVSPNFGRQMNDGSIWFWGWGSVRASRFDLDSARWTVYPDLQVNRAFRVGKEMWFGGVGRAVRHDGRTWTAYTPSDGLIDGQVTSILQASDGAIWVAGIHQGHSAAARFDGTRWQRVSDADGLVGKGIWCGYAAANGDLWFGTKWGPRSADAAGTLRFDGTKWSVYTTREGAIHDMVYDLAQTPDGALWFGTPVGLVRLDDSGWTGLTIPQEDSLRQKVAALCVASDGALWMGHGSGTNSPDGVTRYDGKTWTRFTGSDLGGSEAWSLCQTRDGSVWVNWSDGPLSRFLPDPDARKFRGVWTVYGDDDLPVTIGKVSNSVCASQDGALWLVGSSGEAVRFSPRQHLLDTVLEPVSDRVSSAGNILLKWSGAVAWDWTPAQDIRYQWRLDGGEWSSWSRRHDLTFTSLSSGKHRFEVRALDQDGNLDGTPATHAFVVEAPYWRNPYVLGLGLLLLGLAGVQTGRVVRRGRRLSAANEALSAANNKLHSVNVELQREQVLARLHGLAQGMQSSDDIRSVVEAVNSEFTGLGLPLITSTIGIYVSEEETEMWLTGPDGRAMEPFVPGDEDYLQEAERETREAHHRGDEYHHHHRNGEAARDFLRRMTAQGNPRWKDVPEDQWPEEWEEYTTFFQGGRIRLVSERPIGMEYLMLVKRFGEIFGFAHRRYRELQEKEAQNRRLAVEASVARIRAEVQAMERPDDFQGILKQVTEDLEDVGLDFEACEIDLLNQPVESPTMAHFESEGFRYDTYMLAPDGRVATESYNLAAPFPTVVRQTLERFIAGEPWQGRSESTSIVEVAAGSYGRLRLTTSERERFSDEEVGTLQEFAQAIALGYARYLDIRTIQENTERKSAFLASMSHELRTPMNAIKGFTNLVLRRAGDILPDRQKGNLEKVNQASDHLLAMINDLLDLSKIEAGRMDVSPTSFAVAALVSSCAATVSPLTQGDVDLRVETDGVGEAHTDEARVRQMLINLLSNALKFTDKGSVTISAQQDNGILAFSVADTGKGIPEDELPTLFDEYRQVEGSDSAVQKGTGLGLSITKRFAELLGGSISVESEIGKGSTFTVKVPSNYEEITTKDTK